MITAWNGTPEGDIYVGICGGCFGAPVDVFGNYTMFLGHKICLCSFPPQFERDYLSLGSTSDPCTTHARLIYPNASCSGCKCAPLEECHALIAWLMSDPRLSRTLDNLSKQ